LARSVPPLNPLHVFEVSSRVGSFTKAADVLGVTPSAVSRQIATLESFLDLRLFHRGRDGNTLTDIGAKYYEGIAPAFETIALATERIQRAQDNKPLTVRVPSTFAVQFLIPRLSQFKAEHPSINVRIITGFGPVDFVREDVDISIQVGSGHWPGAQAKLLFANWVQPMCSPRSLKGKRPLKTVDDLRHHRLLLSRNRPNDWREWAAAIGKPGFPPEDADMIEFPNSMLANQAAADGLGVVMGQVPLLGPDFAAQPLTPLFDKPVRQGSYYSVWRAGSGPSRKVRQFLTWLDGQLEPVLAKLPPAPTRVPPTRRPVRTSASAGRSRRARLKR
jgi:LysR family transcriptional regulator, glycine cleavage system transcriptional activator